MTTGKTRISGGDGLTGWERDPVVPRDTSNLPGLIKGNVVFLTVQHTLLTLRKLLSNTVYDSIL